MQKNIILSLTICAFTLLLTITSVNAEDKKVADKKAAAGEKKPAAKGTVVKLADGKVTIKAPAAWTKKKPANRIIEFEFAVPKLEGDAADGRITIMGAGGSVEANLLRWQGQFDGPTRTTKKELKVAGSKIHTIDISGSFKDRKGPFAPAKLRKGYRMIGAIIVTEKLGKYFVKMYGPEKTIAGQQKAFMKVMNSLTVAK